MSTAQIFDATYYVVSNCYYYNDSCAYDLQRMEIAIYNAKSFRAFLDLLAPQNLEPNLIAMFSKCVNVLKERFAIQQPRWSALRWRSTT